MYLICKWQWNLKTPSKIGYCNREYNEWCVIIHRVYIPPTFDTSMKDNYSGYHIRQNRSYNLFKVNSPSNKSKSYIGVRMLHTTKYVYAKDVASLDDHGSFACHVQYLITIMYGRSIHSDTIVVKYCTSQANLPCPVRRSDTFSMYTLIIVWNLTHAVWKMEHDNPYNIVMWGIKTMEVCPLVVAWGQCEKTRSRNSRPWVHLIISLSSRPSHSPHKNRSVTHTGS